MSDLATEWLRQNAAMIGKRVRVRLDEDGQVVHTGRLLGFSDFGTVEVEDADGDVWHGWPMLHTELAE